MLGLKLVKNDQIGVSGFDAPQYNCSSLAGEVLDLAS